MAHVLWIYKSCGKSWYSNNFCLQVTFDVMWRCLNLPAKVNLTTFQAGEVISAPHMTMLINQRCHVVTWGFIRDRVEADNILCRDSLSVVLLCFSKSRETLWRFIYLFFVCRNLSLESLLVEIEMTWRWGDARLDAHELGQPSEFSTMLLVQSPFSCGGWSWPTTQRPPLTRVSKSCVNCAHPLWHCCLHLERAQFGWFTP